MFSIHKNKNIISSKDDAPTKELLNSRAEKARELVYEAEEYKGILSAIREHGLVVYGPQFWDAMTGRADACDQYEKVPGWNQASEIERIRVRIGQCNEIIHVMEFALKQIPKAYHQIDDDKQAADEAIINAQISCQTVDQQFMFSEKFEEDDKYDAAYHDFLLNQKETSDESESWKVVEKKIKKKRQKPLKEQPILIPLMSKNEVFKYEQEQMQKHRSQERQEKMQKHRSQERQEKINRDSEMSVADLFANIQRVPWNTKTNRVEAMVDVFSTILPILRARVEESGAADFDHRGNRILYKSVPVFSLNDIAEHCIVRMQNGQMHPQVKRVLAEFGEEIRKVPGKTKHFLHPRDKNPRSLWGLLKSMTNRMRDCLNSNLTPEEQKLGREWKIYLKDNTQTGEINFDRVHFQQRNRHIQAPALPEVEEKPTSPIFIATDFPSLSSALKA